MRAYLDAMDAAEIAVKVPDRNVVLAALGPKMLALAGEKTKGALPYNVTPEHTAEAKAHPRAGSLALRRAEDLFHDRRGDGAQGRGGAPVAIHADAELPQQLAPAGFFGERAVGGGSHRFLDAMVAWGDAATIRARLQAHVDAGATHVCIQPLNPDGSGNPDWKALEALAP